MRTLSVEVTDGEYRELVALHGLDVAMSHHTVERYLGLTLAVGGQMRLNALQLGAVSGMGEKLSAPSRASHWERDRSGWRNGTAQR